MTDPRKVQGSDAERAEAGLDPEASFAAVDEQTATRLRLEAEAIQEKRSSGTAQESADA